LPILGKINDAINPIITAGNTRDARPAASIIKKVAGKNITNSIAFIIPQVALNASDKRLNPKTIIPMTHNVSIFIPPSFS